MLSDIVDLSTDIELLKRLELPPYGYSRSLLFRARQDISRYLERYNMKTLNQTNMEEYIGKINPKIKDIMPDYIGVPMDDKGYTFRYKLDIREKISEEPSSNHGGLSSDEMQIPLMVISRKAAVSGVWEVIYIKRVPV